MIVAIHQPNYLPWLGYFHKIAQSDEFVFLDDAQYSKNSYTNRVKVLRIGDARWLTQPVSFRFRDPINAVTFAREDWRATHLDNLKGAYRRAAHFSAVWSDIEALYEGSIGRTISAVNAQIVMGICRHLDISCRFHLSSEIAVQNAKSDDRLIRIVEHIAPGGCYLSGRGGAEYQNLEKFSSAGLTLTYADFQHPTYQQGTAAFIAGLSVIDAVFHLGWQQTANLLRI